MNALRKYGMFPVRLAFFIFAALISVTLVLAGRSWRDEWDAMDISGYLLYGKNWNIAGF